MDFITHSHRHASSTLEEPQFKALWQELQDVLHSITDKDIINLFNSSSKRMSISSAINDLIDQRLSARGWTREAPIFADPNYTKTEAKRWRLDFAKQDISVEVAFNHGEATAWNLLKPVMASELNHVAKAIQTQIGIVIFATDAMKEAGAFDNAVGSYEKALRYLKPMNNFLSVPMMIIGLLPTKSFRIIKKKQGTRNMGEVVLNIEKTS
jgi:hypothetical protein